MSPFSRTLTVERPSVVAFLKDQKGQLVSLQELLDGFAHGEEVVVLILRRRSVVLSGFAADDNG